MLRLPCLPLLPALLLNLQKGCCKTLSYGCCCVVAFTITYCLFGRSAYVIKILMISIFEYLSVEVLFHHIIFKLFFEIEKKMLSR
jgi:uncharacterized membrane protein